jgi:hypothetical protein
MRKTVQIVLTILLFLSLTRQTFAQNVAGNSAKISYNSGNNTELDDYFQKRLAIRKVMERYQSPLIDSVDDFMTTCITYKLDCYLLPAITGTESTFGRFIYPNSYNGFGWGRGMIMFKNWSEAINTVGKGLRENYINKGAQTTDQIGHIYAESPTWSSKVNRFMAELRREEENLSLYLKANQVEL